MCIETSLKTLAVLTMTVLLFACNSGSYGGWTISGNDSESESVKAGQETDSMTDSQSNGSEAESGLTTEETDPHDSQESEKNSDSDETDTSSIDVENSTESDTETEMKPDGGSDADSASEPDSESEYESSSESELSSEDQDTEERESESEEDGSSDTGKTPDKIVALTFDDGPDNTKTNQVLDKLENYGVTASFFTIGQKIGESTQDTLLRAVNLGCDIQNHSWGYSSMNEMTAEEIEKSVGDTTAAIETYVGIRPAFFRPPNLAVSALMYETVPYPFISGIMGNDWDASATPESIADKILSQVNDGSIILLHDHQSMTPHPTIEALDTIIPELQKQGYEIVSLKKLFERKGVDPAVKTSGMWTFVQ